MLCDDWQRMPGKDRLSANVPLHLAYTFAEIEVLIPHLLSQKYPDVMYSLGEANWIVVMTCLMQSARPIFGVDLRLLLDVGSDVLSEVRRSPGPVLNHVRATRVAAFGSKSI
eukprot:s547_g12.t1